MCLLAAHYIHVWLCCLPQAHQQEWLHGSWEALDGEAVEKDVAVAHKAVYKAGRAFSNRGATQLAANCDAVRASIEEFKAMVPLVQVRRGAASC